MVLIISILVTALIAFGVLHLYQRISTKNAEAIVTIDGTEYGKFPLAQDVTERIELADGSYNVLVIQNGKADITEASCPDELCVKHKKISLRKESIVCLPNKVVVEIQNGEAADVDVIAG